jgi:F-type H+-transporting ATPase subunit delta
MDASSRAAMAQARERLTERTSGAPGQTLLNLGDELFAVARLLDGQPSLRRALSDAAVKPADRAALTRRLFQGKVSETALDVVDTVVRQRWSRPRDLVEAAETLATEAALDGAASRGELDNVEDELFRFGRIVGGDPDLSRILGDRSAGAAGKAQLIDRLVGQRVTPVTALLLRNTLTTSDVGNPANVVERLSEAASRRRGRSVAHVISAVALTAAQESRLADVLGRLYGRTIGVQVSVDPEVVGGLIVRVGDEVIDGSVAARLDTARRELSGGAG